MELIKLIAMTSHYMLDLCVNTSKLALINYLLMAWRQLLSQTVFFMIHNYVRYLVLFIYSMYTN